MNSAEEALVTEQERAARLQRRWLLAVALLAVLTYANSIPNGFAYDDVYIIQKNERVHRLGDLRSIWLTPYWPINGHVYGLYRPLAIFGYAVQWALSDGAPWLFHAVNVLLHAGVSLLAFSFLARLTGPTGALIGAALFAVHPVHTEVVANVVGQAELLAAAGSLAACVLFIGRPAEGIRLGRWLAVAALYAAAMLAKESAIVLPALLVTADLAYERRRGWYTSLLAHLRSIAPAILLLAPVALGFLGLRVYVLGSVAGTDAAPWLPFLREDGRIFVALRAWMEYVRLLFWPMDLSADYSPGVILPVTSFTPAVLAGAGFLTATVIFALVLPKRPDVGLPAAWFLLAILPVSNLIIPIGVVVAERILYLPSLAVSIAAAYAWVALEQNGTRRARQLAAAAAAAVLVLFGGRAVLRNPEWKSTDTIFAALLRDHPESYRAQWYAAHRASQRRDAKAAAEHWGLACRLWPRDAALLTECGAHYLRAAWPERAVEFLEASRAMAPDVSRTQALLAQAYLQVGRAEDALRAAEQAMRIGPLEPVLQELRASALQAMGEHQRAARAARAAVSLGGEGTWREWAFYARTLFEAGAHAAASAALDTAFLRAGEDQRAREVLTALRDSVSMGTLDRNAPAGAEARNGWLDRE
ncbi:MAG: hypothetical protein DIU52_012580 [bacterium]|nr:MAG: hypothetical protein DIU58_17110 [Sphaerobacter thermophilus]